MFYADALLQVDMTDDVTKSSSPHSDVEQGLCQITSASFLLLESFGTRKSKKEEKVSAYISLQRYEDIDGWSIIGVTRKHCIFYCRVDRFSLTGHSIQSNQNYMMVRKVKYCTPITFHSPSVDGVVQPRSEPEYVLQRSEGESQ